MLKSRVVSVVGAAAVAALLLGGLLVAVPSRVAHGEEIRVITDRTESHLSPVLAAYEKAAGVRIRTVYMDKGLISRLEGRPGEADVVITKDADLLEIAKSKGLVQAFASEAIRRAVPERFRDPTNLYFSDSYRARAIFYSKDRVRPEELSTYEALADRKWKGRICIRSGYHDYNLSLFGQLAIELGMDRTRRFIGGLAENLARTPIGDDRGQARAIFENRCDVALVNSYYMGIMLSNPEQRRWGEATRVFFPDQAGAGTVVLRSGLALTRDAANVQAATALMEYMVQEATQESMANATFAYPVNSHNPLPVINQKLGEGQAGIVGGVFKIREVSLEEVARQRGNVIQMLDEVGFDKPR